MSRSRPSDSFGPCGARHCRVFSTKHFGAWRGVHWTNVGGAWGASVSMCDGRFGPHIEYRQTPPPQLAPKPRTLTRWV